MAKYGKPERYETLLSERNESPALQQLEAKGGKEGKIRKRPVSPNVRAALARFKKGKKPGVTV